MKQAIRQGLRVVLLAASLVGLASAQNIATSQNPPAPAIAQRPVAAVEPAALSGMLAAQNQVRARLGLQPLVWSASLTESAGALARTASGGACTLGTADKALRGKDVSLHWAAAIRRFGGEDAAQELSASYVVSRWREGRTGYDAAKGACRDKSLECAAYARMIAAANRQVGCARNICAGKAQVWLCEYRK